MDDQTKHTPGPWTTEVCAWDSPDTGNDAFSISGRDWHSFAKVVVRMDGEGRRKPEGVANAHLIAAAPDLLQMLIWMTKGLPDLLDGCGYQDEENLVGQALDLIAKATGEV